MTDTAGIEPDPSALQHQLKALRQRKGEISRAFGVARRDGEPLDSLKEQMSEVQGQIRATEAQLRPPAKQETPEPPDPSPAVRQRPAWPRQTAPAQVDYREFVGTDADWDQFALAHPAARIYHGAATLRAVERAFGLECTRFVALSNGETIGTLALVRQSSRLFGDFLTALPFFNYGGALAVHPNVEDGLMRVAGEHGERLGVAHVEFRDDCVRDGWPARTDKLSMLLDLPDSEAALMAGFGTKLRAQIKRPQREHADVAIGGSELLDEFYRVFAQNMRDLGTPVYARRFFAALLTAWGDNARLVVIRLGGQPVASAFVVGHGHLLEIPWASSLRRVNHLSMNMLLYWTVLQYAISRGYRQFDFGRTTTDSPTHRFKAQWGATPLPLYWHYWLPDGAGMPAVNPNNPKYALMIAAWRRLPVWAANLLGPPIVRNIP